MPKNLTAAKVSQIKIDLCQPGATQPVVAKKHHVSRSLISDIATERVWSKVAWPEGMHPKPVKKAGGQRKPIGQFDPTNERILELESELVHVIDERNRERAKNKVAAKSAGIFRALVKEMDQRVKPFAKLPMALSSAASRSKKPIQEHVAMHLSDGHHDQVVTPGECGGLEEYNFPISCARAQRYVDTVIEWTQHTLAPRFNFTDLWVLAYGDHTSGEIHKAAERSYYRNQFNNCFAIGQLHALMYRDLAPFFEHVHVVYVPGNHGRRTPKKDYHGAHDNWDYLIAEIARMHSADLENVSFLVPDAWSVNLLINGVGCNISHGDDVQGSLGIPFYGMARRQKGLVALSAVQGFPTIRYSFMGHHHLLSSLSEVNGELVINGAWPATDSYTFNRFSGYREPAQLLHGMNPRHGITWRMNVKLKHEGEKIVKRRYSFPEYER